ncbi:hypothetical protein MRS76_24870 [Rhizobiaceae bacterium n13]|uniref:Uncharacterized protein n=1 Tax=Ferirhizobium litorale TaxID=2927786 RepID=A0AAE3QBR6_9HYPH|nr:hypothetical protein [Fererhizobium litorale]MDI7865146.1 hypothetical protein [Fererhizobium litorale]MDI7922882.1 hypothetical protein [Fererhizobium litorale]
MKSRSLATIILLLLVGTGAILASKYLGNGLTPENEMLASRIAGTGPSADMTQMDKVTKGDRVTIGKPAGGTPAPDSALVE